MENRKKRTICVIVLVCMLILSYLLINKLGRIENSEVLTPTGNVDIFEISCGRCCSGEGDDKLDEAEVPNTSSGKKISDNGGGNSSEGEQKSEDEQKPSDDDGSDDDDDDDDDDKDLGDVVVYDDYKIWDNKDLRIFSNPAYEYRNIIAPGSFNSYAFIIRNNNDFDVVVDIVFNETNNKNINMQYKLKNDGNYLLGSLDNYETIAGKVIKGVEIPANSYKSYVLDWKWVDSSNDAAVGFDINSTYGLSITVAGR